MEINASEFCTSWKRATSHFWRVHCKYFNLSFVMLCFICESFCKNLVDNKQEPKTWGKLSMLTKQKCHPCFFENSFGYVLSTNLCRKENSMKIKMVWRKQEIQAEFNGEVMLNWLDTIGPRWQVNWYISYI